MSDDKPSKTSSLPSKASSVANSPGIPSTDGKLFPKTYLRSQTRLVEERTAYSRRATELVESETERADALTQFGRSVRRLERLPEIIEEDDKDWAHAKKLARIERERELADANLKLQQTKEQATTQKATKGIRKDLEVRRLQAQERLETYDIVHTDKQIALEESDAEDDDDGPTEETL